MMSGYCPGHPWYYVRGGVALPVKEVCRRALDRDYKGGGGGAEEIDKADHLKDPKRRDERLDEIREKYSSNLKRDTAIYKKCVAELHEYRKEHRDIKDRDPSCHSIHSSMAFKVNHISYSYWHLEYLKRHTAQQLSLLEMM